MSDKECCEHQHGKLKEIVGSSLGGDTVSNASRDVFVGKRSFGDGLGQDGIVASNA